MSPAKIPFSRRTSWDLSESRVACALRERKAAGLSIADLTASNPTRCGFEYDAEKLLGALGNEQALHYDPDPRGWRSAREAVCAYYAERQADGGAGIDPDQVFLTTSTSEAYSWLFRLLCDPGDEVLIAQPSYPLFDFLGDLDNIRLVPYPLIYDHGWQPDLNALEGRITDRTRAIVVVHPNNPTGHFTSDRERGELERICLERGLALIVDEVFLDYGYAMGEDPTGGWGRSFTAGQGTGAPLTFVLSGLSKVAGLPQMKAAWIVCVGTGQGEAQDRLELIADTFLSMNGPIQGALPVWLVTRAEIQQQIRLRTLVNLQFLDNALAGQRMLSRLIVEAGWYAVLRIPALRPDEETVLQLIAAGVSIQPGYYYGFPPSGWLVISLLPPEAEFRNGVELLLAALETHSGSLEPKE